MRTPENSSSLQMKYLNQLSEDLEKRHPYSAGFAMAREGAASLELSGISISAYEGQLIRALLSVRHLSSFVEVGTLTGYSALWILEALGAQAILWTLEKDPKHFAHAKETFLAVGKKVVDDPDRCEFVIGNKRVILVLGDARQTIEAIESDIEGVFIDANKAAYGDYLAWAETKLPSGGIILGDNVFLQGRVYGDEAAQNFSEKQVGVMREFNRRLLDEKKFRSQIVPTAEGLLFAIKN